MSELKTTNVPPRRVIESHTVYEAVNMADPSDRFRVVADTEMHAKIELLDKLGYDIEVADDANRELYLRDVETGERQARLKSVTIDGALDEVLRAAKWRIQEPTEMIGGALSSGFGEVDDD